MRLQREADGNLSQALPLRMRRAISTLSHTSTCRGASITVTFNSPLRCFVQTSSTHYRLYDYKYRDDGLNNFTRYSLVHVYENFKGICCFNLQGIRRLA
jgi:hypothetical protein